MTSIPIRIKATINALAISLCAASGMTALTLSPAALAHCAGNHTGDHPHCANEPPPPPPPDGTACVDSPGTFPAFAFIRSYKTGKNRKQVDHYQLYLANSTGECEILIHQKDGPPITNYSYRQIGSNGRIVLTGNSDGYPTIKMLEFTVTNRAIDDTLPLTETEIYRAPANANASLNDLELAADAQTIYFATEGPDGQGGWLDKLQRLTIGGVPEELRQFSNEGVGGLSVDQARSRVYYASHRRVPDTYQVAYVEEETPGQWSDPIDIVSDADYNTSPTNFFLTSLTEWDSETFGPITALAVVVESPRYETTFIDIFDVSNCSASSASSCFSADNSIRIIENIQAQARWRMGFTSSPSNPNDPPPNLLAQAIDEDVIIDINLDDLTATTLTTGTSPEPAD